MLDGRRATIERIYYDYEDRFYFGVTIDDDPGQDLMRDTGRFLFFFAGELEAMAAMTRADREADPRGGHRQRVAARRRLRRRGRAAAERRTLPAGVTSGTSARAASTSPTR